MADTVDYRALAERFCACPLPDGVAADFCATDINYQFPRHGTNLLTVVQAEAMLRIILAPQLQASAQDASVNDIPDAELLGRAVRGFKPIKRGDGGIYRWAAVGARFALGSTYAHQLCRRFGLDPDEKVRKP